MTILFHPSANRNNKQNMTKNEFVYVFWAILAQKHKNYTERWKKLRLWRQKTVGYVGRKVQVICRKPSLRTIETSQKWGTGIYKVIINIYCFLLHLDSFFWPFETYLRHCTASKYSIQKTFRQKQKGLLKHGQI